MTRLKLILRHAIFAIFAICLALWAAGALTVHAGNTAAAVLVFGGLFVAGIARYRSPLTGWLVLLTTGVMLGGWYHSLTPRDDRAWAVDVSRGAKAEQSDGLVTLTDMRDFDWRDRQTADPAWITRSYDPAQVVSVDAIASVWDSPDIAHILARFHFADQEPVVFSVEIRREEGETFNEIGGFFRQFELVLIAATEEDIVSLRTDHRKETVEIYPLALTADQSRDLFMAYVDLANALQDEPRFYNTLGDNCTTVVYKMALNLKDDLPLDWRLILTGHVPQYLEAQGMLAEPPHEHAPSNAEAIKQPLKPMASATLSRNESSPIMSLRSDR
ncbi:DUF4105 domain-containing protein [Palleronia caenipelagi]|nr:DUF4105 domain-containing protein [Palleronia caenipelagi]